jgi:NAD(P)-dependent dehydrogenase (short-subunit alcohol dehydrogenase family)
MAGSVFITGANAGVGIATTRMFLSKGWNVVATARATSNVDGLNELQKQYPDALYLQPMDLLTPESIQPAIEAAIAKFGRIDVLINNAGIGVYGFLESFDMERIQQQFDTNVFGKPPLCHSA